MIRIAAAAYPLDPLSDWAEYEAKLTRWVGEAAGADLLVFPEYGAMELAHLAGADVAGDPDLCRQAVSDRLDRAHEILAGLARAHDVHILAGSGPAAHGNGFANRATLIGPQGILGHQDKQIMTRYERETWDIRPGGPLRIFDTALGRIGVVICYDAEFPLLARRLVEQGTEILLAPSCTDALAGYWRVRIGAMARALESQCVVVHSPTVGPAPWCPPVDENVGAAAIYGPPDLGFPETGVIAEGALNIPGWTIAEVDPTAIAHVRREGRVLNMAHWSEQSR